MFTVLPMCPGRVERRTHDYARHGTTSLFAALDIATGVVIGRCYPKHRSSEFRKVLDQIEANVPPGLDVPASGPIKPINLRDQDT